MGKETKSHRQKMLETARSFSNPIYSATAVKRLETLFRKSNKSRAKEKAARKVRKAQRRG